MKSITFAFILPVFLFSGCLFTCEDCDDEDPGGMCPSLSFLPTSLSGAFPQSDQDVVRFFAPLTGDTITTTLTRTEVEPNSDGFCDEAITVRYGDRASGYPFDFSVETLLFFFTDRQPETGILFRFNLPVFGGLDPYQYDLFLPTAASPSTRQPNTVRLLNRFDVDGTSYNNVYEYTVAEAPTGQNPVVRFYYGREAGLLRVDRVDGTALLRLAD